ncbi:hypothetical protein Vretimale_13588 [Volvox reticuliferus]|uniref:NADP-dependent oxidoreductase domain-containing protein n=1 Tax=Volvox reticuliferus TaxID=1737510 RepID=A0A8J4GLV8_9CHLO|nr:hypothetical protein Vretifemale_404 [Volvox reticuliferus]GIM09771.1 hypothetical protein Vretimale_13588 [Volvox reticuliferus]
MHPIAKLQSQHNISGRKLPATRQGTSRLVYRALETRMQQQMATSPKATGTFLGVPDMPLLGLGLAALGRPGYINLGHGNDLTGKSVDEIRTNSAEVLSAALGLGIRYFDAARSYGRAEEFLGAWLGSLAPEQLSRTVVGSKWGYYYTADWQVDTGGKPHEVKEHTAANLRKQAAETSSHLGAHLALYQIHSATLESGVLDAADVVSELETLKRQRGWKMGLSLSGVQQPVTLRKAMGVRMSDGAPLFDCVQATFNLLEPSAGGALAEAAAAGMSVIVKEGLANGRLTQRNTDPAFASKLALLRRMADKYSTSVDALSLAAVIVQPFRPMVLSGATTVEQLVSNAAALELAGRLEESDVSELVSELAQPPEQYWAERSALAWN